MGRARRATRIAATAAYGGGGLAAGLGVLGLAGYALLKIEATMARRIVGRPFDGAPGDTALDRAGPGGRPGRRAARPPAPRTTPPWAARVGGPRLGWWSAATARGPGWAPKS